MNVSCRMKSLAQIPFAICLAGHDTFEVIYLPSRGTISKNRKEQRTLAPVPQSLRGKHLSIITLKTVTLKLRDMALIIHDIAHNHVVEKYFSKPPIQHACQRNSLGQRS